MRTCGAGHSAVILTNRRGGSVRNTGTHARVSGRSKHPMGSNSGDIAILRSVGIRKCDFNHNMAKTETVAELPGLSSPCTMKCCQGLLPAFGVGFTPHIQRQTRAALRLRPHPVDTLLPLEIAPVAPLHRMRGGGQQLVVKKRQGLFQGRGKVSVAWYPRTASRLQPPGAGANLPSPPLP